MYKTVDKTVAAGKRTINVKPLPDQGKPADFTGAVGKFDFSVSASETELAATESLTVKVEVNGKGNLRLLNFRNCRFLLLWKNMNPKELRM